jgi:hypothetical protein
MIPTIKTIEELKRNINLGPGYGGYTEVLKAVHIPYAQWEPFCHYTEDHYTRNCISNCEEYELLLLCWSKDQHSPIHSYQSQESWFKVIKGELTIESFRLDKDGKSATKTNSIIIHEGEYTYLNDNMGFHRISNTSGGETASIHLNVDRIKEWEVFNPDTKSLNKHTPTYHSKSESCED